MPAYLVSHRDRALSGEASTRSLIAERVSRLWPDARQMDASNWIVTSTGPADEVRDQLTDLLREGDALIVIGAGSEAAWAGLPTDVDWLVEHLPFLRSTLKDPKGGMALKTVGQAVEPLPMHLSRGLRHEVDSSHKGRASTSREL